MYKTATHIGRLRQTYGGKSGPQIALPAAPRPRPLTDAAARAANGRFRFDAKKESACAPGVDVWGAAAVLLRGSKGGSLDRIAIAVGLIGEDFAEEMRRSRRKGRRARLPDGKI